MYGVNPSLEKLEIIDNIDLTDREIELGYCPNRIIYLFPDRDKANNFIIEEKIRRIESYRINKT